MNLRQPQIGSVRGYFHVAWLPTTYNYFWNLRKTQRCRAFSALLVLFFHVAASVEKIRQFRLFSALIRWIASILIRQHFEHNFLQDKVGIELYAAGKLS